jgi:hypothetical protein
MAGLDTIDPANPCLLRCAMGFRWRARPSWPNIEIEMPARELDEGLPLIGEYALNGRTMMLGKARVLTS